MKRATSGVSGHCGVSEISRIGAESLERTGPTGLGHVSSPFSKPRCETQWSSSLQRELPLRTTPQRGVHRRVRGSPMDRTNKEPFPVHGANFATPRLTCWAGICQPRALRLFKLGDDSGTGAIAADDELVPEFGAAVDTDVARPHCLASKIVNGGLHCVFSF
jgi:hypothetical protein